MLFRGAMPARPKGGETDGAEVTPWMSSGTVSLQKYPPRTLIQLNSGTPQGQICGYALLDKISSVASARRIHITTEHQMDTVPPVDMNGNL